MNERHLLQIARSAGFIDQAIAGIASAAVYKLAPVDPLVTAAAEALVVASKALEVLLAGPDSYLAPGRSDRADAIREVAARAGDVQAACAAALDADLHAQLDAAVRALLELAQAASEVKPGPWRAVVTHDGTEYDGYSRVLAEETTPTKWICRFVAHQIVDSLTRERSSLASDPPSPSVVAEYIAAAGPATVIRMCERDLRVLERHQPAAQELASSHTWCDHCDYTSWPCPDVRDLAVAYGLLDPTAGE